MTRCASLREQQFTQTDPLPPEVGSPYPSAYVYGANNPMMYTDPSGLRQQLASLGSSVPVIPGFGKIKVDLFIASAMAGIGIGSCSTDTSCSLSEPTGNGRRFDAGASLSQSKAQMLLDFSTGSVQVGVNETCWQTITTGIGARIDLDCYKAKSLQVGSHNVNTLQSRWTGPDNASNKVNFVTDRVGSGFNVNIQYSLVLAGIADALAPSIDGSISMGTQPGRLKPVS